MDGGQIMYTCKCFFIVADEDVFFYALEWSVAFVELFISLLGVILNTISMFQFKWSHNCLSDWLGRVKMPMVVGGLGGGGSPDINPFELYFFPYFTGG